MADLSHLIEIKGLRDGLLISLGDADWKTLQSLLITQIDERGAFFQGARLALDVGTQILHVTEMSDLRDALSERNVSLWAVVSDSPTTVKTAQLLGLATRISKPRPEEKLRPAAEAVDDETALWIQRTIRSGTRIEFPGHVVVMGDVNPGAEVVADGSILIWGRLRGAVHAGASKNPEATVCALEMSPTRLQIADEIVPSAKQARGASPQKIFLSDGRFEKEPWVQK
ncbi:MAG: septum site-determining protein MinC [Anaerolinea sp. 4484_236]|nr:MAG: septum site-determining protein MinC [Anaerolinea sp. 4484_236]